jgi:tripartite-type tricarboxylate transporter receptor subunit TctC
MRSSITKIFGLAFGAVAMATVSAPAAKAQDYPSRPIEFIVPWGPGGGADQLARLVAKLIEPELKVSVPVVNVPGATGATGMAKLLAAPADGYSMAIYIADSHALLAGKDARWKVEDITPVAVMIQAPSFIFLPKDSRFKSWAEFEKEAKEKPGTLKVATLGFGSVDDFTLKSLEPKGVKIVQVPFSKPNERYVSILGGHADALYEQAGDVAQFLTSSQMTPALIFGKERHPDFKDTPASYEIGHEVALPQFRSIVMKAGTPPEAVEKVSAALAKVAASEEFKEFLKKQYASADSFIDSSKASAFVAEQLTDMKKFAGE